MRHHRLVGGDEALAGAQCLARECQRGTIRSADQFDHDIGIARAQFGRIVDPVEPRDIDAAVLGPIAGGDGDDLDRPSGAPCD